MAKTALKAAVINSGRPGKPELSLADLRLHAQHVNSYLVVVAHGTDLEDVQRPSYWRNHWRMLRKWTEITVLCEDGSWEAKLRVIESGEAFARVRVLSSWHEDSVDLSDFPSDDWTVEFVSSGWRVRNAKGTTITQGHAMRWQAVDAASGMVRKVVE